MNPVAMACVHPAMTSPTQIRSVRVVLVAAVLLLLTACGSSGGDRAASTTTVAAGGGDSATIVAKDFELSDVTVAPGAAIVLDNTGAATHTATADDGSFELGPTDGGTTSAAGKAPVTPGSYAFHCEIHPQMTATLTVEG